MEKSAEPVFFVEKKWYCKERRRSIQKTHSVNAKATSNHQIKRSVIIHLNASSLWPVSLQINQERKVHALSPSPLLLLPFLPKNHPSVFDTCASVQTTKKRGNGKKVLNSKQAPCSTPSVYLPHPSVLAARDSTLAMFGPRSTRRVRHPATPTKAQTQSRSMYHRKRREARASHPSVAPGEKLLWNLEWKTRR